MSVQPLGSPKFQAFDSNGNPLTGGLLYTYAAGTTTPLATYTDSTGSVANANPVVLDASGYANVWMLAGTLYKFVLKDSGGNTQFTVDNFPAPASSSVSTASQYVADPGGRLSLTTGVPVTTSDVTAATTVYYAPYVSDQVPLYDGTNWALYSIGTGLSQLTTDTTKSPAAVAINSSYDLFVWNDAGTVRLSRGPAWTSDTVRGTGAGTTELQQVNGRWVNKNSISNGPAAQLGLYVGTVHSDGSAQINDSLAKRHLWNTYHRKPREMQVTDSSGTYQYNTGTMRQANGNAANQLDLVVGLSEDQVTARTATVALDSVAGTRPQAGIGVDSTTTSSAQGVTVANIGVTNTYYTITSHYAGYLFGRHTLVWLETSVNATTLNWGANLGSTPPGIFGTVFA